MAGCLRTVGAVLGLGAGLASGFAAGAAAEGSGALVDRGIVGGWRVHSQDAELVVVSPDGKFVLTGRLHAAQGQDVGAALTGAGPVGLSPEILANLPALRAARSGGTGDCSLFPVAGYSLQGTGEDPLRAELQQQDDPGRAAERPKGTAVAASHSAASARAAPSAGEVVDGLEAAYGFGIGTAGPMVAMVADPACPWCATAIHRLLPALEKGSIRMHVVPVAVVSAQSTKAVAAILTHADPGARFVEFMVEKAGNPDADPGPLQLDNLTNAIRDGVQANIETIRGFGIRQVPFFAWRDAAGTPHTLSGLPEDAGRFLASGSGDGAG